MRVEFINPFSEAAFNILKEVGCSNVKRGQISLKPTTVSIMGVAVLVGLAGDVEGRVLIDMNRATALHVASTMNGENFPEFDEMAKSTIQELANMITGQAVTRLHDLGFKFDLTPPAIFTGENMVVSSPPFSNMEALIVPMELGTDLRIEINVIIREKVK